MPSDNSSRLSYHRRAETGAALALVAALTIAGLPHAGNAQTPKKATAATSLEGSWSGGGTVSFASGARERASCRARYSRAGKNSYTVNATCATASGSSLSQRSRV